MSGAPEGTESAASECPDERRAQFAEEMAAARIEDRAAIGRLLSLVAALDDGWSDPRLARLRHGLLQLEARGEERFARLRDGLLSPPGSTPAGALGPDDGEPVPATRETGPGGHPAPRTLDELRLLRATLRDELAAAERRIVDLAIREAGGNLTRAAEQLGLHRVTLHKLRRLPAGRPARQ